MANSLDKHVVCAEPEKTEDWPNLRVKHCGAATPAVLAKVFTFSLSVQSLSQGGVIRLLRCSNHQYFFSVVRNAMIITSRGAAKCHRLPWQIDIFPRFLRKNRPKNNRQVNSPESVFVQTPAPRAASASQRRVWNSDYTKGGIVQKMRFKVISLICRF